METRGNVDVNSVKGVASMDIHRQLDMYGARVKVCIWDNAFNKGKADVGDKQRPGRRHTSTTDKNVCCAYALMRDVML
jgi:hypothetical protein